MRTPGITTYGTLLVANRGEIAIRVISAARSLGLRTVAVYSDADRAAPHVRAADEAVRIGPAAAAESYLSIDALLEAAARAGADAIHPGYGFLSERAAFARAVCDAGLVFVGPTAGVMDLMGRKDQARDAAVAAGVPVVPSARISGAGVDAGAIGFPLLVKAAAGGGGKGMRVVRAPEELDTALAAAGREAQSAFGDATLIVERYVEGGRHVEVQVLADQHGHVVHLFERDCSAQRRHQKVIEEAPAPFISEEVRQAITGSAVALAAGVGYQNAGTVEFLVKGSDAFFLEMNTRLQVEHPVTEMVTGIDLVAWQLRIADGQPLAFAQEDIRLRGHAIEARVYAEDAFHGFLPQSGRADLVRWPEHARIDAALESGQVVGTSYDPMLGKVIVHGANREAARRALVAALDDTAILGLTTNTGFLRGLAASPAFRDGHVDTQWLDAHPGAITPHGEVEAGVLAAWALARAAATHSGHPFAAADGWRMAGPAAPIVAQLVVGERSSVYLVHVGGTVECDGRSWTVADLADDRPDAIRVEIDGRAREAVARVEPHRVVVAYLGHAFAFARPDAFGPAAHHEASDGSVLAPMPGSIREVLVAAGEQVSAGQVLGVLEAMKMEMPLRAPVAGTVTLVTAIAGSQVELGATLFVVEAQGEAA
ncbi:MAG: biotin carboxylase N-terminal domain-containing protein [Actinomycetota bacterium]|nr:biotin carboxylase N-terminal domain-containing protein [Actinomycetota bacterium]